MNKYTRPNLKKKRKHESKIPIKTHTIIFSFIQLIKNICIKNGIIFQYNV